MEVCKVQANQSYRASSGHAAHGEPCPTNKTKQSRVSLEDNSGIGYKLTLDILITKHSVAVTDRAKNVPLNRSPPVCKGTTDAQLDGNTTI